jgi:hypothetical protein
MYCSSRRPTTNYRSNTLVSTYLLRSLQTTHIETLYSRKAAHCQRYKPKPLNSYNPVAVLTARNVHSSPLKTQQQTHRERQR